LSSRNSDEGKLTEKHFRLDARTDKFVAIKYRSKRETKLHSLVDLQLDDKILIYLHIIHLLKSSTVKKEHSFLTGAQDSHLQTVTISEAAYIHNYDVDLLKISRVMFETRREF